ncbi:MAG: AIDA repeat-containing protein, partial [Lentisphaeria bacterium]|nr:AIDA repeat-containing protein [Lentisphaeria bacterium]
MYIYSGGVANNTTVNSRGSMYISSGGTANSTTVNYYGAMFISSGGVANSTTVNSGSYIDINSGGTANDTTVNSNGGMYIYNGGVANSTTVNSSGRMYIYSGGVHRGSLQIESGATVSAYKGAKIDFTVADRNTEDGYLINDLSLIQGTPTYTITVSTDQADGTYKLAQGASNFTGTLTIGNGTVDYGTITVNGADFVHNGVTYSLDQVSGNLTLTVSGGKTAAVDGDLDGNGLADVILVHTKQGYSGAWLTTGTSSVIKWGNLGNVNSKVELIGTGNVNGTTEDGSDIIMKIGTTVAAWVTDGGKVKSYKELYTLKSNMNMLGIGDFDGDGVTDYLLRSTAGDLGYVTGDDNKWHYIKGLGKEWKIAAVGDLDGNGTDDVIVRHDAGFTGAYMIDENGKITWSSLDTLKSDMDIVGTGDFNGDGVDDVLLQNKSNGWVGAWLVEDGRVDSFIGLCNNKNTIEQIADYNADGIDDLRIRTDKGDIGVLYVNGADNTTWKYFQSVGTEWDTSFALIS